MAETHFYTVDLAWQENRKGILSSQVLNDKLEVATPPEFPKGMEGIWSPEHLLVAAVNSCLMTTFLAIAENSKLDFLSFKSSAAGKLEQVEGKFIISEVELKPEVIIEKEDQVWRAETVLQKSEANCLISNSVKSKIIFNPVVKVSAKRNE